MAKGMADGGGVKSSRDVMDYQPPCGPTSIGNTKVGLGGTNYGNCGTQGPKGLRQGESGKAGLGGDKSKAGSQR